MDDEFETDTNEDEIYASITPRKMDRWTLLALYLQHKARKKLVKGDFYISISNALLLHREYNVQRTEFQESASREIEALVAAVEGVNNGSAE